MSNIESDEYRFEEDNEVSVSDIIYGTADNEKVEADAITVPIIVKNFFKSKSNIYEFINFSELERGKWDSQVEYILSLIGYIVGLGNVWRFPGRVYQGGGGSFLIPYIVLCILFGVPLIMLEMSIGQFSGQGMTRAFDFCPIISGIGHTIVFMTFMLLTSYTLVISWCLLYFLNSFKFPLPWSVCTNSFNTPSCINSSKFIKNSTNVSYESSVQQFWNIYVTTEQNQNGSFRQITDPIGNPNIVTSFCIFLVLCLASITTMFGVHVSGKIIYVTVLFPYVVILQLIVLGCSLPGALKGIKYYLYPNPSKLLEPKVYFMAVEQIMFSLSLGEGGVLTMSSFNNFREKIQQNTLIIVTVDFLTSFIAGFATFPILGYMSYESGRDIEDLITADSSLFFLTCPEALASISNSHLWSILFMFMAFTLGIDSLFVLLNTVVIGISDIFPILHKKKHKILFTLGMAFIVFLFAVSYTTPNGLNWLAIYDENCPLFVLPLIIILEVFSIFCFYGRKQYQHDMWLMNGETIGSFWIINLCFTVPLVSFIFWIFVIRGNTVITRNGHEFPKWTHTTGWVLNFLCLSPLIVVAVRVIIQNKTKHRNIGFIQLLKLSFRPRPYYGPRSKLFWTESVFYSKKLIRYKENKAFLNSLSNEENLVKLLKLAQLKIDEETARLQKDEKEEKEEENNENDEFQET